MALTKVVTDGIAAGAVTATQIATNAVTVDDISDGSISTAKLADDSVTGDKLANTAVTAGTYGSSSAIPAITVDAQGRITAASTNSVTQVGGANGVDFNDNVSARFGTGNDLSIFHDGGNSILDHAGTGNLRIVCNTDNQDITLESDNSAGSTTTYVRCDGSSGAALLYHYGSEKFTTTSTGIEVTGTVTNDGIQCDGVANLDGTYVSFNDTGYIRGDVAGTMTLQAGSNNNYSFRNNGNSATYVQIGTGGIFPGASNTYDLGGTSLRWRNIYTNDLNLSNEGGTNDVDGTWGSWTIQEGEDDLFLLNRRNGKKYKFALTEVN